MMIAYRALVGVGSDATFRAQQLRKDHPLSSRKEGSEGASERRYQRRRPATALPPSLPRDVSLAP